MKRILLLLTTIILMSNTSFASHVLGGEISWRCLQSGQYVFFMSVYRDCTGIPFTFEDETISIIGSPLPSNGVSSILMKPDRNRWMNERNGDTSPKCTPQYGFEYNCPNEDPGTVQAFWYQSDPITLAGTPPSNGWRFYWESPCCRPNQIENINTNGSMLLRAIMYPAPNGQPADPCFDSSPRFEALPTTLICRNYEFTYNHTAIDIDLDSLVYGWDRPYNPPMASPAPLTYKPGFSPTNPTPDATANVNNIPATLDPLTGITKLAVYSTGGGEGARYITVVRVDSYRDGIKIATVFREIPISLFSCDPLPNGKTNTVPEVRIDGIPTSSLIVDIVAGQEVSIPVQVEDKDITGTGTQLQTITMVPNGLLFTTTKAKNTDANAVQRRTSDNDPRPVWGAPCEIGGRAVEPCAYLQNQTPFFDASASPPTNKIEGLGIIGTEFVWQTDCKHVRTRTGFPGTNEGIYNFVMRVSDDHCPIPALNYPTITVRVKDPFPLTEPIMKGISVNLDGSVNYQWVPPIDSIFGLDHYLVKAARPLENATPLAWNNLNTNLKKYKQEQKANNTQFPVYQFNNPFDVNSGSNLFEKFSQGNDLDYYIKMKAFSGCTDTNTSVWSEPVRVMELETTPVGIAPQPASSEMRLDWNRSKPLNAKTYPYFVYESPTHYYIYANDSISNGGVADPNNWYIIGDTNATTFQVGATTCNDFVGFRIEARDTVITYKQGSAPRQDSLDTLTFRTFSMIDTAFMKSGSFIPTPKFDTLEVLEDGSIFFKIDLTAKRTTARYNIYKDNVAVPNLLKSVKADKDSLITGSGAMTANQNIVLEAIDGCDISNKTVSALYNTFLTQGTDGPPCTGTYILNWTAPGGFPNGVSGYRVYVDSTGRGYELVETINNTSITTSTVGGLVKNKTYRFRVLAFDDENAVNIAAPKIITTPNNYANNYQAPAPTLRCTKVNLDGSIDLSWIPSVDAEDNFLNYEIEYRQKGATSWSATTVDNGLIREDDNVRIPGLNAQNVEYEIRMRAVSGCNQISPWNTINSIFLTATPIPNDPQKKGELMWSLTGVDYGANNNYQTYKEVGTQDGYNSLLFRTAVGTNTLTDDDNGDVCDDTRDYFVQIIDSLFAPAYRCTSRSNIATARYEDKLKPPAEPLVVVSFDEATRGLWAYWLNNGSRRDDEITMLTLDKPNSGFQGYRPVTGIVPLWLQSQGQLNSIFIERDSLDSRDSSVAVSSRTINFCGKEMDNSELYFHRTMDVEVEWNICDSTNTVTWNNYVGFDPNFDTEYYVFYRTGVTGAWDTVGFAGTDTTINHLITQGGLTYRYQVRARSTDPMVSAAVESRSNIDSVFSIFEDEPLYEYLQYVTVDDLNNIELQFYRDTVIKVQGYTIYRGTEENNLNPVGYISYDDVKDEDNFDFTDVTAEVNQYSYFYNVLTTNDCDNPVSTSNFGKSILLRIEADNEQLTNKLTWNRYEGWDSTVAYYNLYRGIGDNPGNIVYKVIAPNSLYRWNEFVDDVYDEVSAIGKFCYRVEAVQGPVNPDVVNNYPNNLQPATSMSNTVCVVQEPLFYVPNAFAPGGVNKTFGPQGQFYNFSLYEMKIYNRWGEMVFETRDINKGWDGEIDGKEAGIGSYVYMIRFVDANGKEHRKKGTVTLIK